MRGGVSQTAQLGTATWAAITMRWCSVQHIAHDRAGFGATVDLFETRIAEGFDERGSRVDCRGSAPWVRFDRACFQYCAAFVDLKPADGRLYQAADEA